MSRAGRLLELLQSLRRHRRPVTAAALAAELGVSERTVYRDIATLVGRGVPVEGEAGLGYVLRPGFLLPPLMFGEEELEALVLGLRWVAGQGEAVALARAAQDALAKIAAVLPEAAREALPHVGLLVPPAGPAGAVGLALLRQAIRAERPLRLHYADAADRRSERVVWPLALAFFDQVRVLVAWCELRHGFRHFRCDRMLGAEPLEGRYPRRRRLLLAEWRASEGVDPGV